MVQARCLFLTIPVAVAPRVNRGSQYAVRYSGTYHQLSLVSGRPSTQTWGGLRWLHWLPTWRSQSERSQVTGKAGSKSPTSQGQPSVPLREKSRGCGCGSCSCSSNLGLDCSSPVHEGHWTEGRPSFPDATWR
ncbi:hypothetical protein CCHR01_11442 [Colletotrichum chrysophilum]|uniref:Uncharacterized protein n=1 Tax=Colletotrichum chrysophilum TaxID=1836956 RepID=A0AAD9AFC8_9PEZI|nr:hypothetical protein CCHR01_11442 [Colletotrichum chrysophilum]